MISLLEFMRYIHSDVHIQQNTERLLIRVTLEHVLDSTV